MYKILSASKDTYITNKIIDNNFRAKDANVGQAGTLDLFKLYGESTLSSSTAGTANIRIIQNNPNDIDDGSPPEITLISSDGTERTYSFQHGGSYANGALVSGTTVRWGGTSWGGAPQTQEQVATFLKESIEGSAGHAGKITVVLSSDSSSGNTNDTLTLTQAVKGKSGNTVITLNNVESNDLLVNSGIVNTVFSGGEDASGTLIEKSRLLLYFDFSEIKNMHGRGDIDVNDSSFNCFLKLHDVYGGQTTPNNFKLIAMPLAQSFDEGVGYDIIQYSDVDVCNFLTASVVSSTVNKWNKEGASASGSLGSSNIDVIISGTLESSQGSINLSSEQLFITGEEDLMLNITNFASGVIGGNISNHGMVVAFSGSYETDDRTYFVKRFASRNSLNTAIRPKVIVRYNDAIVDNHNNFIFDVTGSLYLNNFHFGSPANIVGSASGTTLTGPNCMKLKIESGSFKKLFNVSQARKGIHTTVGMYSASFAISSFDSNLTKALASNSKITFNEVWTNASETITFLSSSFDVAVAPRSSFSNSSKRILLSMLNLNDSYTQDETTVLRVFLEDRDKEIVFKKLPFEKKSDVFSKVFYRVVDTLEDKIIIPFDTSSESTKLSSDSEGMYFKFFMSSLPRGRSYRFDFLIKERNVDILVKDVASNFNVR